ncbi:MAG: DEAD/DEAH box helicase family protein [Bacteroidota bacterium]
MISEKELRLFSSLFKGREDIYAYRWVRQGNSAYSPAYKIDWDEYRKYQQKGGTLRNYKEKEALPLTSKVLYSHLLGKMVIGIYPLLKNNTSWFIAADFDKSNWKEEIKSLYDLFKDLGIPAYIERSRSGNGGHLWIFFEENYPAKKSRAILFELLRQVNILSPFEKEQSFDRLFPNQDYHKGLGLGNLIALPLQGNSVESGNSVFLYPESFAPISNQWKFIQGIRRISSEDLDKLYNSFIAKDEVQLKPKKQEGSDQLSITLSNQVYLSRNEIPFKLTLFIREHLNFPNADYIVKKRMGRSVFKTEMFFKLIEEKSNGILIPRGFVAQLVKFCKDSDISFSLIDQRQKLPEAKFESIIDLYPHQEAALRATGKKDFGVIVAPPGSGKTIIGLQLIANKAQAALIIVHRKQLLDQWVERIQSFLQIPKREIGQIASGKKKIGDKITVAMVQSLNRHENLSELGKQFGTIIIDECHHIPAKTFRETITHFHSYYLYGLTATPKRKMNDEKLIYVYIGEIISNIKTINQIQQQRAISVQIKETTLQVPFNYQLDHYETLSRILIYDTQRNKQIVEDISAEIENGKRVLILSERIDHVQVLDLYLRKHFETISLTGEDSNRARSSKITQIKQGHFQAIISTGQLLGEGFDLPQLEVLFLVYPFSFEGKLIQYIGRGMRSSKPPIIYDYRDSKIDYFEKLFKKRKRHYNKLQKGILI